MRLTQMAIAMMLVGGSAVPVFADDAMSSPMMMSMKAGEVVSIMSDGHMGTSMMTDAKAMAGMMKMGKPLTGCVMFMTGKDGKVYEVKPTTKAEMDACDKMAM